MDAAHKETDKLIAEMEKKLQREYTKAAKELKQKADKYMSDFAVKDAQWQDMLAEGTVTQTEYNNWRMGQIMTGKRWNTLQNQIAEDMVNANNIAHTMVYGYQGDVYALNLNFATYEVEQTGRIDTNFTLYDGDTVQRLMKDDPDMLPPPGKTVQQEIADGKAKLWNKQQVQSVMTQGILQGESIDQLATRLAETVTTRNYNAAVRYARTMTTNTQNAGRYAGYRRAKALGVDLTIEWSATLDNRTRHTHRQLDGQRREVDEPFNVDGVEILYPAQLAGEGSSDIPQSMIWNCRCTLLAWVKGYEADKVTSSPKMGEKTYEEWQDELFTLETATKHQKYLQQVVNSKPGFNEKFDGIWKNKTVTYADYDSLKGSIPAKRAYYEQQIQQMEAEGRYGAAQAMQDKLDALNRFDENGAEYSQLLKDLERAQNNVIRLTPAPAPAKSAFGPEAYTADRKNAALWAQTPKQADNALRSKTGEVWRSASYNEKEAIYEYTQSYHKFNEPLRGIEYGTNVYKGVGNTDLNASYAQNGDRLNYLTDILNKCTYDQDVWLQRGVGFSGMDKFFNVDMSLLRYGSEKDLQDALLGTQPIEYGFMSCGSSKGKGFSGDMILNVYAPSGTKMMYVEPFSAFGKGADLDWDGISGQSSFGYEVETLIQQGTQFRVAKVERQRSGDIIYVDLEVINQDYEQRYKP